MKTIPKRVSLVAQTLEILRDGIRTGMWQDQLPSESSLTAKFQVSRATLRSALGQLLREGWIEGGQGKRRRITKLSVRRRSRRLRTVTFLTPFALRELPSPMLYRLDDLREHLAEAGFKLEVDVSQGAYSASPNKALEELVHQNRTAAAWVLYFSTPAMQKWFSARGLPCVICGSRHEGVALSSIDVDYRATCRHAAQRLITKDRRNLVLLMPKGNLAGDRESELGFMEAKKSAGDDPVQLRVFRHGSTVASQIRVMDRLLKSIDRPDAFIVAHPEHVVTAVGHLIRRMVRLPQEMSLVSRDDDPFLSFVVPSVARYSVSTTLFARKVSRVVLELAQSGSASIHDYRLIPEFVPGNTL